MKNTSDAVHLSSVVPTPIVAQDENKSNSEIIADNLGNSEINLENISDIGYKAFILDKFIQGSGILPSLCNCLDFCSDLEFSPGGDIDRPVAHRLGWDEGEWTRFGFKPNRNYHAAFIKNEDGSDWQAIINKEYEGKQYRYLAPSGIGDVPFLPPIPFEVRKLIGDRFNLGVGGTGIPTDGSFWDWLAGASIPIVITEGAKKSLALLSQGIPAIALYGIACGVRDGELKEPLKRFISEGRKIIWACDNDNLGSDRARSNNRIFTSRMMEALAQAGAKATHMRWSADFKGVDDLIVHSPSKFDAAWTKALYPQFSDKMGGMLQDLEWRCGSQLRMNQLSQEIEFMGEPVNFDCCKVWWSSLFHNYQSTENISQALISYSTENAYNPYLDWLLEIETSTIPSLDFERIASKFLGNDDPLANIYLRKTLIASVARAVLPGCKHDTVCVLQGSQGIGKSSFWAAMAGKPEFFDDSLSCQQSSDKDEKLKINRFPWLELAELESLYRRKDVSSVRSLVTSRVDSIRLPYGRQIKSFPRRSIFVASVNPSDFLSDSEGNRRFWVIPCAGKIVLPSEEEVRGLYAAAIQAYRSGESWWLSREEEAMQSSQNKAFEQSDPWESVVLRIAANHEYVSVSEILSEMQIPIPMQSKREEMRVSDILRRNGYQRKAKRFDGKVVKLWHKDAVTTSSDVTSSIGGVVTEVVTVQDVDTASISDFEKIPVTTVTTYSATFRKTDKDPETSDFQKDFGKLGEEVVTVETFSESLDAKGFDPVTTSTQEVVTPAKVVTLPDHFLYWDRTIDDTSEDSIDWQDILFPPRGLWDCQHLILQEGAPVWCPAANEIGFISRVVLDDDDQIKIWEVVGSDGRERPWYPGECEPA